MKTARIQGNVVAEFLLPVPGHTLAECFHPGVLEQCAEVEDTVELGWVRQDDGTFAAPSAPTADPNPAPADIAAAG